MCWCDLVLMWSSADVPICWHYNMLMCQWAILLIHECADKHISRCARCARIEVYHVMLMCYRCADALMHCLEHVRMIQLLTHRCADENISGYADVLPRCKCADVLTCADVLMCSFVDVLTCWHCDVLVGCKTHLQMCHVLTVTLCWRCYTYWQHVNWFIGH